MKIRINGKCPSLENKEVRRAVRFYLRECLSPAIIKTINLTITFKEMDIVADLCTTEEDRRTFFMCVANTNGRRKTLMALAHECAHIIQYSTGRLMDYARTPDKVKFDGRKFKFDDSDDRLYFKSPWEIEAYGLEFCLYKLYKKFGKRK